MSDIINSSRRLNSALIAIRLAFFATKNAQHLATAAKQTGVMRSKFGHEDTEYYTKSPESFRSQASVARSLRTVLRVGTISLSPTPQTGRAGRVLSSVLLVREKEYDFLPV